MREAPVKTWTFRSNSNPNKTYETSQYADGSTSCQCRGWTFAKNGVRSCTHTRKVEQGIADREALSVWNDPSLARTSRAAPAQSRQVAANEEKLAVVKKQVVKEKTVAAPRRRVIWQSEETA